MMRMLMMVLCVTALAIPASASKKREFRVTMGGSGTRISDQGLLAVTDSSWLNGGDIGFMIEVDHGVLLGGRIRGLGGAPRPLFEQKDLDAAVGVLDLLATARWHGEVFAWLRPFIELELGAANASVRFERADIDTNRWGFGVAGTGGIELRLPPGLLFNNHFSVGLDLAGGYGWRSEFAFDDVDGIDLGSLDLKGPYFRVAVTVMW